MRFNPSAVAFWGFCAGVGYLIGGADPGMVAGLGVGLGISTVWIAERKYRIKPEPKPDTYAYGYTEAEDTYSIWYTIRRNNQNIKATFDGETGKLKSIELIAP